MNIVNNKRKRDSQTKIKAAFLELLETKNVNEINITDIVKLAKINRSTFYANYQGIHELIESIQEEMFEQMLSLYQDETKSRAHSYNYLPMFKNIRDNQDYYKLLFKLGFDYSKRYNMTTEAEEAIKFLGTEENLDYHIEFFKAGMTAIIKKWLANGCVETPEEMTDILRREYGRRIG